MKGKKIRLLSAVVIVISLLITPASAFAEDLSAAELPAAELAAPAEGEPAVPTEEEPAVPAEEEPAVPAEGEPAASAEEEPAVPAEGEPAASAEEEPAAPAEGEPEAGGEQEEEKYTVEFSLGSNQYIMQGNGSAALDDILGELGIAGHIDSVTGSNDALFHAVQDENGIWTVQSNECFVSQESLVVVVDGVEYAISVTDAGPTMSYVDKNGVTKTTSSFSTAANSVAAGGTITLLEDITDSVRFSLPVMAAGKTLTLDLNGHALSFKTNQYFMVNRNCDLTIAGSGTITAGPSAVCVFGITADNAKLTIGENVTVSGATPVLVDKGADVGVVLNVEGTLIASGDNAGININGANQNTGNNAPVVNFSGTIRSESVGIYAGGYAVWNLDGDITAGGDAINGKSGTFNITGGNYTANGAYDPDPADNSNGTSVTGAAVALLNNANYARKLELSITGGTFTSTNGNAVYEGIGTGPDGRPVADGSIAEISISGGTFISPESVDVLTVTANAPEVTGGIYSDESIRNLVSADTTVAEADGMYSLGGSITDLAELANDAGVPVTVVQAAPDAEIQVPAGTLITNASGSTVVVNNNAVADGQTVRLTVPVFEVRYVILEGKNQTWGEGKDLEFRLNVAAVLNILIDDEAIDMDQFVTILPNGTVILSAGLRETLASGEHTITFVFSAGSVSTGFVIE